MRALFDNLLVGSMIVLALVKGLCKRLNKEYSAAIAFFKACKDDPD